MTIVPKTLLTISIVGLAGGSVVAYFGENASLAALTVVLPLGAVSFGVFLIVFMLEKEVAVYDREQVRKLPGPPCNAASAPGKFDTPAKSPPTTVQGKGSVKIKPSHSFSKIAA